MPTPTISALPEAPSTSDPANFATEADAFIAGLSAFRSGLNTTAAYIDALLAGASNVGNATSLQGETWGDRPTERNAIINGDMGIAQRGVLFTAMATETPTLDRWVYVKSGAMVHSAGQSNFAPSVAAAGRLMTHCLHLDCTTADTSIAATDLSYVRQVVEGYNFRDLAQRACTMNFWVRATKIGTYCVALLNSALDRSLILEYSVGVADTWEEKTLSIPASPVGGNWNYDSGAGLLCAFTLAAGSTYQTTPGAWQTGEFYGSSAQVNACDDTANNFFVTGVCIVPGNVAPRNFVRPFGAELALCQRYFEKSYPIAVAPGTVTDVGMAAGTAVASGSNSLAYINRAFQVQKRATPTIVAYSNSTGTTNRIRVAGADVTPSQFLYTGPNQTGVPQNAGGASFTANDAISFHYTASAEY